MHIHYAQLFYRPHQSHHITTNYIHQFPHITDEFNLGLTRTSICNKSVYGLTILIISYKFNFMFKYQFFFFQAHL